MQKTPRVPDTIIRRVSFDLDVYDVTVKNVVTGEEIPHSRINSRTIEFVKPEQGDYEIQGCYGFWRRV